MIVGRRAPPFDAIITRDFTGKAVPSNLTLLEGGLLVLFFGNNVDSEVVKSALPASLDDIYNDRTKSAPRHSFLYRPSNADQAALVLPRLIDTRVATALRGPGAL
jgi:hypothetical protein